jgi:hypothetical protein
VGRLRRHYIKEIIGATKEIGPHDYKAGGQKAISFKMTTQGAKSTARYKETLFSERKHWGEELVL